jgi:hypothetical protein
MAGKTHLLITYHYLLLQRCEWSGPVFREEGGNPPVVADSALFSGIGLFGMLYFGR